MEINSRNQEYHTETSPADKVKQNVVMFSTTQTQKEYKKNPSLTNKKKKSEEAFLS